MKLRLMLASLLLASSAVSVAKADLSAAVPLDVHPVAIVSNDVPAGTSQALSQDVLLPERTVVAKTGEGTLEVSMSPSGPAALRVQAREGAVRLRDDLAAGTVPELTDAIKAKLALWVSVKDKAHVVLANGVEVERWYDVRETNMESPTCRYLQAFSQNGASGPSLAEAVYVRQYSTLTNTMEMVYFGGYGSGQSMQMKNADGTAYKDRLYETSVVYGRLAYGKYFGYLFGMTSDTNEQPLWTEKDGHPWAAAWAPSSGDARVWMDGKDFALDGGTLPFGFHAMHQRFNTLEMTEGWGDFENALFARSGKAAHSGQSGGEYLGEVMVFSSRLTDLERARVQAYLERKWFAGRSRTAEIAVEEGATVEVTADGTSEANVRVAGGGSLVKKGAGTLVYRPKDFAESSSAEVAIEGGAVQALRSLSVRAAAGDVVTSTFPGAEVGETVTLGKSANPRVLEKAGEGFAAISSIPAGTRRLRVSGGTLALRPTRPAARRYEVAIPNGDFSDWGNLTGTTGNAFAVYGGWSRTGVAVFYDYSKWLECGGGAALGPAVSIQAYGYDSCPPPEGGCVLGLKVSGSAASVAGVVFSEPGEYELSYLLTARGTNYGLGARLRNYLTDVDGGEIEIGTATARTVKDWSDQKAFRFRVEKAGAYTLHFDHVKPWYDGTVGRDDMLLVNSLHLYRVGDSARGFKVPGGDFENVSGSGVGSSGGISSMLGTVQVSGWTFDDALDGSYARSGVVDCNTYCEAGRRYGSAYNASRLPLGGVRQMLMRRSGAFAATTFTPPKGRWYLKAHLAYWGDSAGTPPTLSATLTRADGEAASLGALAADPGRAMIPCVWSTPFEADGAESVTLRLELATSASISGVQVDDVELVGEYENGRELLVNGDFELPYVENGQVWERTGWMRVGGIAWREYGRNDTDAFGTDHGSGDYFAEPFCQKDGTLNGFFQDVSFPHGGWYRLSYLAKTRRYSTAASAPVGIFLADVENCTTSRVDSVTRVAPGVYAQRTTLFRVDEACSRRLLVLATENNGNFVAFDDFSVRYVGPDGDGALSSPDPEGDLAISVDVAAGAKLQLDFAGTNVVNSLYVNGVKQAPGVVDASTCPSLYGPGALLVSPRLDGTVISIR